MCTPLSEDSVANECPNFRVHKPGAYQGGGRGKVAEAEAEADADGKTDLAPNSNTNTTHPNSAIDLVHSLRLMERIVKYSPRSLSGWYSKKPFNRF